MPYSRPDLPTLINRALADIETRLPGGDARLRRSNLNVLARVHSGAVHGLYGYINWLADQIIIDTAESEWLERHAAIWGVARKPAAPARGLVTVTGGNGAAIPAETLLTRSDGARFIIDAAAVIVGSQANIPVTAFDPGKAGNTAAGSSLNFATPLPGVQTTVIAAALEGGADAESDDLLRARLLARIQQPPHGGAEDDYVMWALQVPGVTRAWPFPFWYGPGTLGLAFVRDDDDEIIPGPVAVTAVQAHIDSQRPVTAEVIVFSPTPSPLHFIIDVVPDTPAIHAAIEAELRDLLRREATPGSTILLSHIREALSLAPGEHDHTLIEPTGNVTHGAGEMAVFGSITFI
ncbi:MAG: baseplate J/gp47 family protein [Azonexus sp.]|jgi:uncharacterized phage protein gp47/JayE|nr:baseplate J/gp47 family protein [Azonexus sp.]